MKTLKLVGLNGYISAHTNNVKIEQDQVVKVAADVADYMLKGGEIRNEEHKPHWEEVSGVAVTHDFTSAPAIAAAEPAVVVAAQTASKVSQRAPRSAPASI